MGVENLKGVGGKDIEAEVAEQQEGLRENLRAELIDNLGHDNEVVVGDLVEGQIDGETARRRLKENVDVILKKLGFIE